MNSTHSTSPETKTMTMTKTKTDTPSELAGRALGRFGALSLGLLSLLAVPAMGCSEAGDGFAQNTADGGSGLDPGVGQGGAQDFGLFREILFEGDIPGPETIDDLGFFAEHKIALPEADCGDEVCIHGMLGVMGNMISGSNCTVVLVGMNTSIDPALIDRPPLNLSIAVDLSKSMAGVPIARVRDGLLNMRESLDPADRITLVGFGDGAEVIVQQVAGDSPEYEAAVQSLTPAGATNIYAGLRTAFEEVDAFAMEGMQNRVLLVSDGVATGGLTSPSKIENLVESWASHGYGLTTVGLGESFDVGLMGTLAELGNGSFYYVENPQAVEEVFVEEVEAFTIPLAKAVTIDVSVFEGYDLRAVYGTKQVDTWGNQAHIDIPILQIAHRKSDEDNQKGRRGGGGAILLELLPTGESPGEVGRIEFEYEVPGSGEIVEQSVDISSPLAAWETPENGYFGDDAVQKGFVMLNIYVGFRMASTRASSGDYAGALTVLRPLLLSVQDWLVLNPDEDIEDDLLYINLFIDNLEAQGGATNTPNPVPPEPWPSD